MIEAPTAHRRLDAFRTFPNELPSNPTEAFFPESLLARPSVQYPGSAIPVGDDVVHVSDEDGVVCEIEEIGLLAQRLLRPQALDVLNVQRFVGALKLDERVLELVARASERVRPPPLCRAERPDQESRQCEDDEARQLSDVHTQRMERRQEEIVESQKRECRGDQTGLDSTKPRAEHHGAEEQRCMRRGSPDRLDPPCDDQRDHDGHEREPVAQNRRWPGPRGRAELQHLYPRDFTPGRNRGRPYLGRVRRPRQFCCLAGSESPARSNRGYRGEMTSSDADAPGGSSADAISTIRQRQGQRCGEQRGRRHEERVSRPWSG